MNDRKLVDGLTALADSTRTPDIDVDAVIRKSRTRSRRRTAVVATALGTTVVLGGVLAFGGPLAGSSPPVPVPEVAASGEVQPYPQLPKGEVPVPNVDESPTLPVFAGLLKAKVPVVVPGAETHEQTFGTLPGWDFTSNYASVDGTGKGSLRVRVFGTSAAKVMRQLPPGGCKLVEAGAPAGGDDPLCYRQPDGSYVRVDGELEGAQELPAPLSPEEQAMTDEEKEAWEQRFPQRPNRVAKHYRADGTIVEVWGGSPVTGAPPTVFTDEQLIALAVDPAFTL
ncbi:hypothetical protein [Umezawaea sp. Da 62-37]|uniref:hypothetical protein n=1 Tax=Umezawaea sp. Da 62-37 TaxID=3075927 RepID=UPI0028F73245|nr:hypothetical protein [Umezawaea sp. Da 62-37]WNV85852.1 hypothetical protein RM788_48365 [Umezawaea sp. Da 62-37]